jgi:polar amino acid transport system substrate-binding protein
MKISGITIAALLFLQFFVSPCKAAAVEKVSLQLSWKFQFEYAGFIMAKEKGFYKDANLDVTLEEYLTGTDIVEEVLTQKNNYGIHNSSVVINDGVLEPVILMATYSQQSPLVFVVSREITYPKDLIGKVISGTKDELKYSSLSLLLNHFYITYKNTKFIDHSFGIDDFINHKVDAMTAFRTNQLYLLDKQNIQYNIIDPSDFGFIMSAVNLFTSKSEALNYPDRTQRFIEASNKGWVYALENVEETIDVILDKYSKLKSRQALMFEAAVIRDMMLLDFFEIGETNKALSLRAESQFHHSGLLRAEQKLGDFLFQEIIDKAESEIQFTQDQKHYLQNKQKINICVDPEWMPFESIVDGKHIGITADIFNKFRKQLPVSLKLIKTQSWQESLFKAQRRDCDVLSLASATLERLKYMDFTSPYINLPIVIATTLDKAFIGKIESVKNEKLGVVKGYAIANILRDKINGINIVEVESISDGLKRVESGELFGYVDNLMVIANSIQKDFTGVLKVSSRLDEEVKLAIGTRNDEPILKDIFEKLVKHLSVDEQQEIFNRWVAVQTEVGFDFQLLWKLLLVIVALALGYLIHYIKLKKLNTRLLKLSITDTLTGLSNRLKMDEVLIHQQAVQKRYDINSSIILIDIDFFKQVNDTYGHPAGDSVLVQFAGVLKDNVRVTDFVGRWGGEEFLIVCPNITQKEAGDLATKLVAKVRVQNFTGIGQLTISAGVSQLDKSKTIQKIITSVDQALYRAKQGGRDQVCLAD